MIYFPIHNALSVFNGPSNTSNFVQLAPNFIFEGREPVSVRQSSIRDTWKFSVHQVIRLTSTQLPLRTCQIWFLLELSLVSTEMVGVKYMDGDATKHEYEVDRYGAPPQHSFPPPYFQIPQHTDADKQSGDGTRQMRHIANLIVYIIYCSIHR